jgi:hypothetical protein
MTDRCLNPTTSLISEVLTRLGYDGDWNLSFSIQVRQKKNCKFKVLRREGNSIRIRTKPGGNETCWESLLLPPPGIVPQECFESLRQVHPEKLFIPAPRVRPAPSPPSAVATALTNLLPPTKPIPAPGYLSGMLGCGHVSENSKQRCMEPVVETLDVGKGTTYAVCLKHMGSPEWLRITNLHKNLQKRAMEEAVDSVLAPLTTEPKPVLLSKYILEVLGDHKSGLKLLEIVNKIREDMSQGVVKINIRDDEYASRSKGNKNNEEWFGLRVNDILSKMMRQNPPLVEKDDETHKYKLYLKHPEQPEEVAQPQAKTSTLKLDYSSDRLKQNSTVLDQGLVAAALVMNNLGVASRPLVTKSIANRLEIKDYIAHNSTYNSSHGVTREIVTGLCDSGYLERNLYNCEGAKPTSSSYQLSEKGKKRLEALRQFLPSKISEQLLSLSEVSETPLETPIPIPEPPKISVTKQKVAENLSVLSPLIKRHDELLVHCKECTNISDSIQQNITTHNEAIDGIVGKITTKKVEVDRLLSEIAESEARIKTHKQSILDLEKELGGWNNELALAQQELESVKEEAKKALS